MPKAKNPVTFTHYFKIDPRKLAQLAVLDPTLDIDTRLFLDPLLFPNSVHSEIRKDAVFEYRKHFERVIKFLSASKTQGDVAWRSARRLLEFHEIKGTCLGYGAGSIDGSAFGKDLTDRLVAVGKEIVDLGIDDPDLFQAMALFEAKIGPDRISDMATNVVRNSLIAFNARILKKLSLDGEPFQIVDTPSFLLKNPFQDNPTPIILVPADVLRKLPIARDWDDIADAASKNQALRNRVNEHIGHIWEVKTKRDKKRLRLQALSSNGSFQTLLDAIHQVPPRAYNVKTDPDALVKWAHLAKRYATAHPLRLTRSAQPTIVDGMHDVVRSIVARFRQLIEHKGLYKELYKENGKPRHESTAQRLFFAIAYCYCEANDLDLSPEVDTGSGQVDFKLSKGFKGRVLVEAKLSTNPKLLAGYAKQLEVYKKAEQTTRAIYLVIDVGHMGKKAQKLIDLRNQAASTGAPLSDLEVVNGLKKVSASKM